MTRRSKSLTFVLAVVVFIAAVALTPPRGPRSMRQFDPARLASLELRMWQAYYANENVRLFALLVTMLHEQFRYSWATATAEAFHLARAASRFSNLHDNDESVLPDLESAYDTTREWMHAGFDPRAVARAELAWWVARRVAGQNSPEQVGRLMAEEYALLYETSRERVETAALLRARAGALRDTEAANPDWSTIGRLLHESYLDLSIALQSESV